MAERYKQEIGRAIATRRELLGMTQTELAHATHYKDGQTVSRWENGRNLPADLDAVAAALEWTLADLVRGVDPPNERVARQLGLVEAVSDATPEPFPHKTPDSDTRPQLDRIEQKLDAVLKTLVPSTEERSDLLEQVLVEAAEALRREQARDGSGKRARGHLGVVGEDDA